MVLLGMGPAPEPASWLEGTPFLKIPRRDKANPCTRSIMGQAPAHPTEAMISINLLQQTGHANTVLRATTSSLRELAAERGRSAKAGWLQRAGHERVRLARQDKGLQFRGGRAPHLRRPANGNARA